MTDLNDEPSLDELNREADIAADYLEGLLDTLDFDGDIEMGVRDGRPLVQIVADDDSDIRSLIGHNGEVVEALQRLTRLAVQEKVGQRSRLILDIDGYLARRRRHLRDEALDAIDEVNETGEPVTLEDMNSYERKIIHDIVREEGMRSRSHGVEPHRHVTIYLPKADRDERDQDDEDDSDIDEDEFENDSGDRDADLDQSDESDDDIEIDESDDEGTEDDSDEPQNDVDDDDFEDDSDGNSERESDDRDDDSEDDDDDDEDDDSDDSDEE